MQLSTPLLGYPFASRNTNLLKRLPINASWHILMYGVSNDESHYTVWTTWISVSVSVRVRVDFILQNLAQPYMCQELIAGLR